MCCEPLNYFLFSERAETKKKKKIKKKKDEKLKEKKTLI